MGAVPHGGADAQPTIQGVRSQPPHTLAEAQSLLSCRPADDASRMNSMNGAEVSNVQSSIPSSADLRGGDAAPEGSHRLGRAPIRRDATIVLVMLLWALCFPLIVVGLSFLSPLYFAGARALLAGAPLLLVAVMLRRPWPTGTAIWGTLLGIGVSTTSLGFLGMFLAGQLIAPGFATVIANTQPLIAAMLAAWLLGERLGLRGMTALLAGFGGIVTMTLPRLLENDGVSSSTGIVYVLAAAIGVAAGNVLMKRLANRVDPLMAMGWQLVLGALPLMVAAILFEPLPPDPLALEIVLVLTALALAGTALPFYLWFSVLRSCDLSRANTFSFLTPVFGMGLGVGLFGERLAGPELIGIGLVLVGVWQIGRTDTPASGSAL